MTNKAIMMATTSPMPPKVTATAPPCSQGAGVAESRFASLNIDPTMHNHIEMTRIYLIDIPLTYCVIRAPNWVPMDELSNIRKATKIITLPLMVCLIQPKEDEKITSNISVPTAMKDGSPTR
jgi:hypothetical protein